MAKRGYKEPPDRPQGYRNTQASGEFNANYRCDDTGKAIGRDRTRDLWDSKSKFGRHPRRKGAPSEARPRGFLVVGKDGKPKGIKTGGKYRKVEKPKPKTDRSVMRKSQDDHIATMPYYQGYNREVQRAGTHALHNQAVN